MRRFHYMILAKLGYRCMPAFTHFTDTCTENRRCIMLCAECCQTRIYLASGHERVIIQIKDKIRVFQNLGCRDILSADGSNHESLSFHDILRLGQADGLFQSGDCVGTTAICVVPSSMHAKAVKNHSQTSQIREGRGNPKHIALCNNNVTALHNVYFNHAHTVLDQGRRSGICSGTTMSGRPNADQAEGSGGVSPGKN